MKKIESLFCVCLCTCVMFSCSESENGVLENVNNKLNNSSYYVKSDGALCFTSVENYYKLADSISNMAQDEFDSWEKKVGFTSYKTIVDKFINEIEDAQDIKDEIKMKSLLAKYENYVRLTNDSLVVPVIQSNTYRCVTNKDGVFYLNEAKNVVDGEGIYVEGASMTKSTPIKHSYLISNTMTKSEFIDYENQEYVKSDNTKSINANCKLLKNIVSQDVQGNFYSMIQLEMCFFGRINKKIGGWQRYESTHSVENAHALLRNIPQTVKPDGTLDKLESIKEFTHDAVDPMNDNTKYNYRQYNIGVMVKNFTTPLSALICIHFLAKSGGTAPEGLGYNYYNGNYQKNANCPVHAYVENKTK